MMVFIGTMEHGEGDFQACKDAIRSQADIASYHFIVSNLPEKDAHEKLYTQWNLVKSNYDLFIKVDADTVLAHPYVIKTYVDMFTQNPRLTGVQAWLFDHMTNDNIYGLTCVRNTVTIATTVDKLYCDKVDTGHDIVLRGAELPKELIPAGDHCKYATEVQAFHYGFHRGKKKQRETYEKVLCAWKVSPDRIRGMAVIGFHMAHRCDASNYDDVGFRALYNEAIVDYDQLLKEYTK